MGCEQEHLAGACGAWCGGCLALRGEIAERAAALEDQISRQGFLSLASRLEPEDASRIDAFFDVLDRIARTPACPGCGRGGGVAACPVRACAQDKDLATCATCSRLGDCEEGRETGQKGAAARRRQAGLRGGDEADFPFSPAAFFVRLTRKYQGWNLTNLAFIREKGLSAWIQDMQADPDFRSVQVKTRKDVFGDD
jgi:hypothetical protein